MRTIRLTSRLAARRRRIALRGACCMVPVARPRGPEAGRRAKVSAPATARCIIGTYPKQFWIIDEATEKVVGTIPFKSGIPRRTTLSRDRKRFYTIEAGMEKVEIIDIAARKTIDTFTLSEGNKKVRIRSIEPDPLHRFVDAGHGVGDQADRSLRDRRADAACSTT